MTVHDGREEEDEGKSSGSNDVNKDEASPQLVAQEGGYYACDNLGNTKQGEYPGAMRRGDAFKFQMPRLQEREMRNKYFGAPTEHDLTEKYKNK